MCGRYALYGPHSRLREQFGVEPVPSNWQDRYNIAPTQTAPVIRVDEDGARRVLDARWGLVPSWAKGPGTLHQPINAKLETAAEMPMFRHAFKRSRALVPASGFYEWMPGDGHKQPYYIRPANNEYFAFAGLLERWEGPDGVLWTYAILTTEPNELISPIHNRMPAIIQPSDYPAWLDPGTTDSAVLSALAGSYPADAMQAYAVGRAVGNPRAQGADLIRPLANPLSNGH